MFFQHYTLIFLCSQKFHFLNLSFSQFAFHLAFHWGFFAFTGFCLDIIIILSTLLSDMDQLTPDQQMALRVHQTSVAVCQLFHQCASNSQQYILMKRYHDQIPAYEALLAKLDNGWDHQVSWAIGMFELLWKRAKNRCARDRKKRTKLRNSTLY